MNLNVDHVTVAGQDLEALTGAFTNAGFSAEYGGSHSNGVTHMSIVRCRDGSYIELISAMDPALNSPWWNAAIRRNGGPCAWAIEVDNIAAASERLRKRGVVVEGPRKYERERPDGTLVKWELSMLGGGEPGTTLPFLISDHTPRELRVEPSGDTAEEPVVGIDTVVLSVADLSETTVRFETAFELDTPERGQFPSLNATIATFTDAPITLAEPHGDGWLADRLARFGPCPAAYVLQLDTNSTTKFDITAGGMIADRDISWLSLTEPIGRPYIGAIDPNY